MPLTLLFIFTFIILLAIEIGYIPLARKNGWSTERNKRSDGHPVTVIGGGIIFYIAMVIWSLSMGIIYRQTEIGANFLVGITMLAACSFADDLMQLKVWIRLVVQFVAVLFLGFQCSLFDQPPVLWPIFMICTVGFVNAYNFMDGINGITAAYSIAVLGLFLYIDTQVVHFMPGSMIVLALISLVVFGFFNYRRRALVFAGDVGSITMGYIVATALIYYILETHTLTAIIFVAVYGVDTFMTVVRRASEGENIFKPHRKHIYQILNYVWRAPQRSIAFGYSALQLAISAGYLMMRTHQERVVYCLIATGCLTALYFILMTASENRRRRIEQRRKSMNRYVAPHGRKRRHRHASGKSGKSADNPAKREIIPTKAEHWN